MDWNFAIRRNREALERILAALFSLVWLNGDPHPEGPQDGQDRWLAPKAEGEPRRTLPRHLHAHARRILRAAESAIRRLIVIAARDVAVKLRPGGGGLPHDFGGKAAAGADGPLRIPAFPLLDPLKRFHFKPPRRGPKSFPRICVVGFTEPAPLPDKPVLSPDDPVDAAGLCRRLLSSRRALANLPREARRLARWQMRRRLKPGPGPGRVVPLRMGRPPGGRKRPLHAVDDVLKECHALALDVLSPPDTS